MSVSLALIILDTKLCQHCNGFVVFLSRVAISNLFFIMCRFFSMASVSLAIFLREISAYCCYFLCPWVVFFFYGLASCRLVDNDYGVLRASGCGSLVIFHVGWRSQPWQICFLNLSCAKLLHGLRLLAFFFFIENIDLLSDSLGCQIMCLRQDYEMLCAIYYLENSPKKIRALIG